MDIWYLTNIVLVYITWFITLLILDYIWLWYITKRFIIKEFWNLIVVESSWSIKINLLAWILAWLVISAMIVTFVTLKYDNYFDIILYSSLLWFFSYSMYDLTNLTFIRKYSIRFTILDIVWWTFACIMIWITSYSLLNFLLWN